MKEKLIKTRLKIMIEMKMIVMKMIVVIMIVMVEFYIKFLMFIKKPEKLLIINDLYYKNSYLYIFLNFIIIFYYIINFLFFINNFII